MLLADLLTAAPPGAPALAFDERTWTFGELAEDVARVAALVASRTAPGDRVALVGRNRPAFLSALYGIPLAGRVAVPLNQRLAPAELAAQVDRVGAALVIGDVPGAVPWADWEAATAAHGPRPHPPPTRPGCAGLDPLHQRDDGFTQGRGAHPGEPPRRRRRRQRSPARGRR